jgi:N-sulfoglucosamine sulfohydrolase
MQPSAQPVRLPFAGLVLLACLAFSPSAMLCAQTTRQQGVVESLAIQSVPRTSRPNLLILMADNWAWPHASVFQDTVVKTPTFDSLAKRGVLFDHSFCLVPSCSPARAAFLTGQTVHRLRDAANLHGGFPKEYPVFTNLLSRSGYRVGFSGKGWGPGKWQASGRDRNPAGEHFSSFEEFLNSSTAGAKEIDQSTEQPTHGKPFCFWFSSRNPHLAWDSGQERKLAMRSEDVSVPAYLPDDPIVRDSMLDYYSEVEMFDAECQQHLALLDKFGHAENTVVIMCGDNGWQMPHGLAHVYDAGTRVPLVIAGPTVVQQNVVCSEMINFDDFAPTILALAEVDVEEDVLKGFTGRSFLPLLTGLGNWEARDAVFLERERHANVRSDNASYPVRAVRTKEYLFVHNLLPQRWPTGDPELWFAVGPYGDTDFSPTKQLLLDQRERADIQPYFQLNFGKRPEFELYDLKLDPDQTKNVAEQADYATIREQLYDRLHTWMIETQDPRATDPKTKFWDEAPYFGNRFNPNRSGVTP